VGSSVGEDFPGQNQLFVNLWSTKKQWLRHFPLVNQETVAEAFSFGQPKNSGRGIFLWSTKTVAETFSFGQPKNSG
jgi:hypothetical protein